MGVYKIRKFSSTNIEQLKPLIAIHLFNLVECFRSSYRCTRPDCLHDVHSLPVHTWVFGEHSSEVFGYNWDEWPANQNQ